MTRLTGKAPKPWVKLWREERGSFAQLPLYTRALAAELLKLADEDGVIGIGSREPWEAVCWLLGATRGDRRMVRRDVGALLADGYIEHDTEAGCLRLPGWSRWQGSGARPRNEATTTEPRRSHDRATTEPRPSNETEAKCPESLSPPRQEGEGEEEGEREGEQTRATGRLRGLDEAIRRDVERRLRGVTPSRAHADVSQPTSPTWGELARWCADHAERTDNEPANVAALIVSGWAESERVERAGHPISWLRQNPGEWYQAGLDYEARGAA